MANISTAGWSSGVEGVLDDVDDEGCGLGLGGLVGVGAGGETLVFLVFFRGVAVLPFLRHDVEGVLKGTRRCVAHCGRERWLAEREVIERQSSTEHGRVEPKRGSVARIAY